MQSLQLFRRSRLQIDGKVLQRPRLIRCVGVLRRVQPHRPRSSVSDCTADSLDCSGRAEWRREIFVRRHGVDFEPGVLRLHHNEPWLRRQKRAARQLESPFPFRGDDGAGLRAHRRDFPVQLRFRRRAATFGQDCDDIPAVLRATELPKPLRLRNEVSNGNKLQGKIQHFVSSLAGQ